jgi:menaquinone-dependent protoporphyrinogen oxidase
MTILVAFESVEGHTAKIARRVAEHVEDAGHTAVLSDLREPGFAIPGQFDAVILCGPIHMGRYPAGLERYINDFGAALNQKPSALITVSLSAASDSEEERSEIHKIAYELCETSGWAPRMRHDAAGALKYLEYNYFKRMLMRYIVSHAGGPVDTSQDYEMTDWAALETFVQEFLKETFVHG